MSHPLDQRQQMIRANHIDLVLDVGANIGQYGIGMRDLGYTGRIVSFEPMSIPREKLLRTAQRSGPWAVFPFALGDETGTERIHIAGNSISSSILPMLSAHEEASPHSRYTGSEEIRVERLDDHFSEISAGAKNIWLKLDVQGFEDRVLRGASATMASIRIVQIELSLKPLYESQWLFDRTIEYLRQLNFRLVNIEPVFWDKATGELLSMDGIFLRT